MTTQNSNNENTPWTNRFARLALLALSSAVLTVGCVASTEEAQDDVDTVQSALEWNPKRHITGKLGMPNRMLVGLGNDLGAAEGWDANKAHAFTVGPKMDLHYLYLGGFEWWNWNPDGSYITRTAQAAKARGVVPMYTLYQAAAWGENNLTAFNDASFMTNYWKGVRTMYKRLGELGSPSVVHIEPDLWGYFQQKGESPSAVKIRVGSIVPECKGLTEDAAGFGKCIVKLGRQLAPKAIIGFQASSFAAHTNGVSDPKKIALYLNKVGAGDTDFVAVETLDRDAGCFERAIDARCKRSGKFYWGDAEYRSHLAWAKTIHTTTGKGLIWWQMPLGVPSTSSGSAGAYRDNRVQWMFAHPKEFSDAGGAAVVFGVGAPNQTTAKTDGGQFKNAATKYLSAAVWF